MIIGLISPIIVCADESNVNPDKAARQLHTRSLTASCAACHGAGGNNASGNSSGKIASLAGISSTDFVTKMQAFKSGERPATVMHHHAKGLNTQEMTDLAAYFSAQIPRPALTPPAQKLAPDHAN